MKRPHEHHWTALLTLAVFTLLVGSYTAAQNPHYAESAPATMENSDIIVDQEPVAGAGRAEVDAQDVARIKEAIMVGEEMVLVVDYVTQSRCESDTMVQYGPGQECKRDGFLYSAASGNRVWENRDLRTFAYKLDDRADIELIVAGDDGLATEAVGAQALFDALVADDGAYGLYFAEKDPNDAANLYSESFTSFFEIEVSGDHVTELRQVYQA